LIFFLIFQMVIKSQSFHASVKSNMFQVFQNEANKTTEPRRFSGKIKNCNFLRNDYSGY